MKTRFQLTVLFLEVVVVDDFTNSDGNISLTNYAKENNVNNIETVVKKYKASCFNDYPEVYTYYLSVSIIL